MIDSANVLFAAKSARFGAIKPTLTETGASVLAYFVTEYSKRLVDGEREDSKRQTGARSHSDHSGEP
jgi:hypothetical protein